MYNALNKKRIDVDTIMFGRVFYHDLNNVVKIKFQTFENVVCNLHEVKSIVYTRLH